YRNKRLIIKGTWFNLIKKEEMNKLIRVKIDIPNTLDSIWKIDIKKSKAIPPEIIKKELRKIINSIEKTGQKVYKQRGFTLKNKTTNPVWNRVKKESKYYYEINRNHPLFQQLFEFLPEKKSLISSLFSVIENSFPVDLFFNDLASRPEEKEHKDIDINEFTLIIETMIDILSKNNNDIHELAELLRATEPFSSNLKITNRILEDKGII
ncbi:MAG: hypothetical protein JXR48_16905, partial [Candidatus Delongbacteria bacterium]|nr:hypothetical protein [Candidatus Delongbacteria bacterium]